MLVVHLVEIHQRGKHVLAHHHVHHVVVLAVRLVELSLLAVCFRLDFLIYLGGAIRRVRDGEKVLHFHHFRKVKEKLVFRACAVTVPGSFKLVVGDSCKFVVKLAGAEILEQATVIVPFQEQRRNHVQAAARGLDFCGDVLGTCRILYRLEVVFLHVVEGGKLHWPELRMLFVDFRLDKKVKRVVHHLLGNSREKLLRELSRLGFAHQLHDLLQRGRELVEEQVKVFLLEADFQQLSRSLRFLHHFQVHQLMENEVDEMPLLAILDDVVIAAVKVAELKVGHEWLVPVLLQLHGLAVLLP